jgi:uncharacterized membrane protein
VHAAEVIDYFADLLASILKLLLQKFNILRVLLGTLRFLALNHLLCSCGTFFLAQTLGGDYLLDSFEIGLLLGLSE